jgi:hypothetical protein
MVRLNFFDRRAGLLRSGWGPQAGVLRSSGHSVCARRATSGSSALTAFGFCCAIGKRDHKVAAIAFEQTVQLCSLLWGIRLELIFFQAVQVTETCTVRSNGSSPAWTRRNVLNAIWIT